jgi:putative methionine-R-sulfoxide reductase with GAF domain
MSFATLAALLAAGLAVLLGVVAFQLVRINRAGRRLKAGDLSAAIPSSRLPLLAETASHLGFLSRSINDLHRMEEYAQKTLAYEKKELAHFLEKENLARQMKKQLLEIQDAVSTISGLNLDLEVKNRSLNDAINRLSALNQISRMLGSTHDHRQVHQMVVSLPMALLGAEVGHLLLLDQQAKELVLEYSQGMPNENQIGRRLPMDTGVAGWVVKNRKPLLIADFARQDLFSPASKLGYLRRTEVSVPVMIKDDLIGVISLVNRESGQPFNEEDRTLLATIASEAAMALHNLLLLENVQNSYFGMVKALITAVEA